MFERAIQFLKDHNEIALATCEGNLPKLRIFQIMKQEGHVLYFATSAKKAVWRELRQNPNVEILAYADNISVSLFGHGELQRRGGCEAMDIRQQRCAVTPLCELRPDGILLSAHRRDGLLRPGAYPARLPALRPHRRSSLSGICR